MSRPNKSSGSNVSFTVANQGTFPVPTAEVKTINKDSTVDRVQKSIKDLTSSKQKPTYKLEKSYFQKVASDLSFTTDVVKRYGAHSLPYESGKPADLYGSRGIAKDCLKESAYYRSSEHKKPINYHPPLFYLKREKTQPSDECTTFDELDLIYKASHGRKPRLKPIEQQMKIVPFGTRSFKWDEYVVSQLSWSSAKYIVKKQIPPGVQQNTLIQTLATRDKPKSANSYAVSTPRGMTPKASGRERAKLSISDISSVVDGNVEDLTVPQKLTQESNRLRNAIKLKESYAAKDLRIKDEDDFRKHISEGAKPIHHIAHKTQMKNQEVVQLTDDVKFKLQLLDFYPPLPEKWYTNKKVEAGTSTVAGKRIRGQRPWKSLPQKIKDDEEQYQHYGKSTNAYVEPDHLTVRRNKDNMYLKEIVREWRKTWHLNTKFLYADLDKLLADIKHDYEHVRIGVLQAITVAIINENVMQNKSMLAKEEEIIQAKMEIESDTGDLSPRSRKIQMQRPLKERIPKELLDAIIDAMHDPSRRVRLEAAIGIMTLGLLDYNAKQVLDEVLHEGGSDEKWEAAKCLARHGYCNTAIVGELIFCLSADSIIKHEKATLYLRELSKQTSIINSMLAEQLNNTSWKSRAAACNLIPKLYGTINKDLTQKLINLMWSDWHQDVKEAAWIALAKAGQGKIIHTELKKQMVSGTEREKVDALKKFAAIGISTSDIIDSFLYCFRDEYDRVRFEACVTAETIASDDKRIMQQLIQSVNGDINYKVKVKAMNAISRIGKNCAGLSEALLWAIRYENHPEVRAEACKTVGILNINNNEVIDTLQDRLTLDSSSLVRTEATTALILLNKTPAEELEITKTIRDEVQQLTTKQRIVDRIIQKENQKEKITNYSRLLDIASVKIQAQSDAQVIRDAVTEKYGVKIKGVGDLEDYNYHDQSFWSGKQISKPITIPSRSGSRVQFLLTDAEYQASEGSVDLKSTSPTTRESSAASGRSFSTEGLLLSEHDDNSGTSSIVSAHQLVVPTD